MVQVVDGENAFFLFGYGGYNKVPRELIELATRQDAETAMAPGEGMFSALDAAGKSRALYDLLLQAGAREF